jgi:hypothetical protein
MKGRLPILLGTVLGALIIGVFARAAVTPSARSANATETSSDGVIAPQLPTDDAIGGEVVSDVTAGISSMPFEAFEPVGLGSPRAVYQTDSVIEFDYDTESGPLVVEELVPQAPADTWPDQIKASLSLNGESFTHGTAAQVSIRNGKDALLLVAEDNSSATVQWYETNKIEIFVYGVGPSPDQVEKIADGI